MQKQPLKHESDQADLFPASIAEESKRMSEEDPVNQFLKAFAKFKESVAWIRANPDGLTDEIVERFFRTVADPLDEAWDKISVRTKDVLIAKKIV